MSTGIFIKTYLNDLPWLNYCMQSIQKYAIGIDEIVIAADENCRKHMDDYSEIARVIFVPGWDNGYIQQQYVKLHADNMMKTDHILFVDSDCVFHDYFSENSFMLGRKPVLLKTRYSSLQGSGGEAWKPITEKAIGWEVEWEYMRRMPMIFHRDSLTAFRNATYPLIPDLRRMTDRSFSEFNALGAFIERYEADRYQVVDTEKWLPEAVAKQFWSWSGITDDIRTEIERLIDPPLKHPTTLEKLRSRDDFGYVLDAMGLKLGAEIGVAFGENAEQILMKSSICNIILVDPWNYVPDESPVGYGDMIKDWPGCEESCREKIRKFGRRADMIKCTSQEASIETADNSLDFVYIDANHMSPMVDRDLELWYPKVRPGGIFGGHDYHDYQNEVFTCNVKRAVDRFFYGTDKQIHIVPGEVPSWYVIK